MSQRIRFDINISAAQILAYYKGTAQKVSVQAHDGRRIEFPAEKLRPFLSHNGVYGIFELEIDKNHRFIALHRVQ